MAYECTIGPKNQATLVQLMKLITLLDFFADSTSVSQFTELERACVLSCKAGRVRVLCRTDDVNMADSGTTVAQMRSIP